MAKRKSTHSSPNSKKQKLDGENDSTTIVQRQNIQEMLNQGWELVTTPLQSATSTPHQTGPNWGCLPREPSCVKYFFHAFPILVFQKITEVINRRLSEKV